MYVWARSQPELGDTESQQGSAIEDHRAENHSFRQLGVEHAFACLVFGDAFTHFQ